MSTYRRLLASYGPQHWWPGPDPLEIVIGAILTQAVAWRNVEKAITSLKQARLLSLEAIASVPTEELARHIRPTIYYNQKARKLKDFSMFIKREHQGNLDGLLALPVETMRRQLLQIRGIGDETADSIILYAANKPSFVIDSYTRRVFKRLGLIDGSEHYLALRTLFMKEIPRDVKLYNEYHALIVHHAKEYCLLNSPICLGCPLEQTCPGVSTGR